MHSCKQLQQVQPQWITCYGGMRRVLGSKNRGRVCYRMSKFLIPCFLIPIHPFYSNTIIISLLSFPNHI
jgi:hypothetical protein